MNFLSYFGSFNEQISAIEKVEDELLMRKIISLGIFSDVLKDRKVTLFISNNRYGTIEISAISEFKDNKFGLNDVEMMLATDWCSDTTFMKINSTLIQSLLYVNDLLKAEDSSHIELNCKKYINSSNNDWLKLIFQVLKKEYLYSLLMSKILETELEVKEGKIEFIKV